MLNDTFSVIFKHCEKVSLNNMAKSEASYAYLNFRAKNQHSIDATFDVKNQKLKWDIICGFQTLWTHITVFENYKKKVSFNIASVASYVYILSWQKLISRGTDEVSVSPIISIFSQGTI